MNNKLLLSALKLTLPLVAVSLGLLSLNLQGKSTTGAFYSSGLKAVSRLEASDQLANEHDCLVEETDSLAVVDLEDLGDQFLYGLEHEEDCPEPEEVAVEEEEAPQSAKQVVDMLLVEEVEEEEEVATDSAGLSKVEQPTVTSVVISELGLDSNELDPPAGGEATLSGRLWVELLNTSDQELDLKDWLISDGQNHQLKVAPENSDADLDLVDDGETVVKAGERLLVFCGEECELDFAQANNVVRLLDREKNVMAEHQFAQELVADQSLARYQENEEVLYKQSVPTPGRPNAETMADLEPQARLWQQEAFNAKLAIFDAVNYERAEYSLEYSHLVDEQPVVEAMTGVIDLSSDQQKQELNSLYLATCSSHGVCVPHLDVDQTSFKLTITLFGQGLPERTIVEKLTGDWQQ